MTLVKHPANPRGPGAAPDREDLKYLARLASATDASGLEVSPDSALKQSWAAPHVLRHCPVDLPPPPAPKMPACSSRT